VRVRVESGPAARNLKVVGAALFFSNAAAVLENQLEKR
jgi:hypothetical protein